MSTYDQFVQMGENNKQIEVILNFHRENVTIETIAKALNVSKDYINKVIAEEIVPEPDIWGRDKK